MGQAPPEFSQGITAQSLPGPLTEFSIAVHQTQVTHRLKLQQVTRWAAGDGKSPRVMEHNRIRKLLGTYTKALRVLKQQPTSAETITDR